MRQLIIEKNQDKNGLVIIDGKDFHYLRQVLRVKAGDMVKLRLSDRELYNSTVAKIDDSAKKITLQICAETQPPVIENVTPQSTVPEYTLFQFIPKPQKLELIVRQATECEVNTQKRVVLQLLLVEKRNGLNELYGRHVSKVDLLLIQQFLTLLQLNRQ